MVKLILTLPYPLVLPNKKGIATTRQAAAAKIREERVRMAWEIAAALAGFRPAQPIRFARVQVFRHSVGEPDTDNLYAACKPLLDVLQPCTPRRTYGLGVIENDSPLRCELRAFSMKAPRRNEQFTRVVITEIDAKIIAAARRAQPLPAEFAAA